MKPKHHQRDLFGEIVVSLNDVSYWLRTVPRIEPDSPRAAYYTEHWNVIGKIRAAKESGNFPFFDASNDSDFEPEKTTYDTPRSRLSHHIFPSIHSKNPKIRD
jgi:hypothetical protein